MDDTQQQDTIIEDSVDEWKEKYARALADYQNLQRRMQEDRVQQGMMASRRVIEAMLPVLDVLLLAQQHSGDQAITLCVNQFLQVLEHEGVRRIETVEQPFNPEYMECVTTEPAEDGKDNSVLKEVRAGFLFHGTIVLRTAQVIVGRSTSHGTDK